MLLALAILSFLCAVIPCALFCWNLRLYLPPPAASEALPAVSILIPARNEAAGIGAALDAALRTEDCDFEIVVMDDASTDGTANIVQGFSLRDGRVRLEQAPSLPPGWNGKQHACWALAQVARNPVLCFVDADVRLAPQAIARMTGFLGAGGNGLVSGFPRQITGTFLEWLLLPLIHFVLLGFLPIARMRKSTDPALAAGCGQFLLCDREAYFACGGHAQIKETMHDGLRLPRLFRATGYRTDLADLTGLATCRMYTNAHDTWFGLAKNATEGIASPGRIVPITLVLVLGQVLPTLLLCLFLLTSAFIVAITSGSLFGPMVFNHDWRLWFFAPALIAAFPASYFARFIALGRFRQDWRSAALHPLGILILLAIQWYALVRKIRHKPITWRTRAYSE